MKVWLIYSEPDEQTDYRCPSLIDVYGSKMAAKQAMIAMIRKRNKAAEVRFENLGGQDVTPCYDDADGELVFCDVYALVHQVIAAP